MVKTTVVLLGLLTALPLSLPALTLPPGGDGEGMTLMASSATLPAWQQTYEQFTAMPNMPDRELFRVAVSGYERLQADGALGNSRYLTVVDFSLPSTDKRLWVLDMETHRIAFHTYVAHGVASGSLYAKAFSDIPESHQSSLGFYLAAESYQGKHGLSMRLDGLEAGFNANARERAIVFHGADYADPSFLAEHGRLGRSQGCPSVPQALSTPIIEAIQGNSCLFLYAPDTRYLNQSHLVKPAEASLADADKG